MQPTPKNNGPPQRKVLRWMTSLFCLLQKVFAAVERSEFRHKHHAGGLTHFNHYGSSEMKKSFQNKFTFLWWLGKEKGQTKCDVESPRILLKKDTKRWNQMYWALRCTQGKLTIIFTKRYWELGIKGFRFSFFAHIYAFEAPGTPENFHFWLKTEKNLNWRKKK